MITKVIMPKLGETMEEGAIGKWLKKEGDKVEKGEVVFECATDKANFEVEAPKSGVLRKALYPEGAMVKVIEPVAYIADSMEEPLPVEQKKEAAPVKAAERTESAAPVIKTAEVSGGRIFASPIVKKLAADKGIDLSLVKGTGPGGRIVEKDIRDYISAPASIAGAALPPGVKAIPLSNMRKIIAQRLQKSMQEAPHFYVQMDADMTAVAKLRAAYNEKAKKTGGVSISVNDLVIYAVARALKKFELLNSHFVNNEIRQFSDINVGVAVALEAGLVVPVLKKADTLSLVEIAKVSKELAVKAKENKLTPEDMAGGTFTISNMGMLEVDMFTAIINPPQVCILAVGTLKTNPVFSNGNFVPGQLMKLVLSSDHRAVDGMHAAKFLYSVREILEKEKCGL